jgi:hypothetical protein
LAELEKDVDLSALDLSDSETLKPSPVRRFKVLEGALVAVSCSEVEGEPRPCGGDVALLREFLPLKMFPALTSLMARAPKLILLAKGEALRGVVASPSSTALSSTPVGEPDPLLDELPWRDLIALNGEVCVGEPERPMVEIDMRRRCCACAAAAMGPGYAVVPVGDFPRSSLSEVPGITEALRAWPEKEGEGGGEFSLDIVFQM